MLVSNTSDVHFVILGKMSNLTTRVHGDFSVMFGRLAFLGR